MTPTHYIVQTASAQMPNNCWGRYGRVAVLEVEEDLDSVSMISDRARGCVRVIETWERRHIGSTERCAFERARTAAEKLAEQLNARLIAAEVVDADSAKALKISRERVVA